MANLQIFHIDSVSSGRALRTHALYKPQKRQNVLERVDGSDCPGLSYAELTLSKWCQNRVTMTSSVTWVAKLHNLATAELLRDTNDSSN